MESRKRFKKYTALQENFLLLFQNNIEIDIHIEKLNIKKNR